MNLNRVLNRGLTANQCMAARYLHADGWTYDDLTTLLEVSSDTIERHLNHDCDHPDLTSPLEPDQLAPEEIRAKRLSAGLTQRELANKLGVSPATISGWETGSRTPRRYHLREFKQAIKEERHE